jgi:hypothetical protein
MGLFMSFLKTLPAFIKLLCRGNPEEIIPLMCANQWKQSMLSCLVLIVIGSGVFGAVTGLWRAPLQGFYVAIKFPLLILLTTVGNSLINGMLAQLLGSKVSFKQSFLAILMSFAIASAILGALAPVSLFLVWNMPPMGSAEAVFANRAIILFDVIVLSFAGTTANVHLYGLISGLAGSTILAKRTVFSWLAINLLLGGQLSWMMRPFIGNPSLPVQFFRKGALDGNFFEAVFGILQNMI